MSDSEKAAVRERLNPTPTKGTSMRLSTLPTSAADPYRELTGRFDLVYPVHVIADHVSGAGNDWVDVTELGFPHSLRSNGWLYLKAEGRVTTRCRALRVEYREHLHEHTPDSSGLHAAINQAAVLALDAAT